jgi:hypothetical protein
MESLLYLFGAALVSALAIAELIRRGLADGDCDSDPVVHAQLARSESADTRGRWTQAVVTNPSASTALIALSVRRARWRDLAAATAERGAAGRRFRVRLAEQTVGAVPAGERREFWLWAEGDARRLQLVAAVGTPGRLRLHRIPLRVAAAGDQLWRPVGADASKLASRGASPS